MNVENSHYIKVNNNVFGDCEKMHLSAYNNVNHIEVLNNFFIGLRKRNIPL